MEGMNFNLQDLFAQAFGVKNPVFIGANTQNSDDSGNSGITFSGIELKDSIISERTTWMGTPIVFPFTLKGGVYKKFNSRGEMVDHPIGDFLMPAATLIDFSRSKTKVKTTVSGGMGTVKEIYGFDDWQIRVRGLCLTDNSRPSAKTAQEQKKELLKFDDVVGGVGVVGSLFIEKEILQISMSDISFRQMESQPDVVPFEFTCESDIVMEFII